MLYSLAGWLHWDAHEARHPAAPPGPTKSGWFNAFNLLCSIRSVIAGRSMAADRESSINARCLDISRTNIARTFHRAFGYPLLIDSARYVGWAVEKSDAGAHGARLVACPARPRPGKSYQKLIDTTDGNHITDLRTRCVGGRPVVVWKETRRERDRFATGAPVRTDRVAPSAVFSDEELLAIEQFVRLIGLDRGTLHILRRRADRRLYVVDVDMTDGEWPATAARRPEAWISETGRIRRGFA